jgi:outer membrane receptor protein involved in Fe transport
LHGVVKSGGTPLPGVTVTAQNTLTGKRFSTITGISGAWALTIPRNGRYVVRAELAAFAAGVEAVLLTATTDAKGRDVAVNFDLVLASWADRLEQSRELGREPGQGPGKEQGARAIRQLAARGAENLNLMSALSAGTETQADLSSQSGAAGAELPSIAGDSGFGEDSVAISGQAGEVSPLAGLDMDRVRDTSESLRAQGGLPGGQNGVPLGQSGPTSGNFGGGGNFGTAGGGFGDGFGGSSGFGSGRGNFRGFNPGQPHGAIFWTGSNSALNAEPFSLRGQLQEQPSAAANRFGLTFMSAPYLPGLTKPSGKDTFFLTLSGQRSATPSDQYATVPTEAEREGTIPGLATTITPVSQATALLGYFPEPNLPGATQNYHLLTTAQTNSTQAGVRYMRSLGKNAAQTGRRGFFGGSGRRTQNQGLRQSLNFNYNWSHTALDDVNIFPQLGGKTSTDANSVQAGYTVGYHKLTSIFNAGWNRTTSQAKNFFTDGVDIASQIGILGPGGAALNPSPRNYGLPNVTLSNLAGLNEQQPNSSLTQTISFSETLSWIHGQHNLRFGGDYRRVHRDSLGGSNATGSFYFTGAYTGSALGDFLLGEPQETTIASAAGKTYLRDNVMELYAQDDWRIRPKLTLNYGLRYEYFAPYTEKYGRLAMVDTDPGAGFTNTAEVEAGGVGASSGKLPDSLVFPYRTAFAPRVGLALRLPRQTVLRAGFGINYTVGQYATLAAAMAHQPPFANEQTNEAATLCGASVITDCLSLANGFPAAQTTGSYALEPHYKLPYVEVWNLDLQKTLRWGVVLNVGYNGSRGNHLDITSAPLPTSSSQHFNYDQSAAYSKFNAGTVRLNKRLSHGLALGANYQYSHSIDDAGSVGGTSTVVVQNWRNLKAEEGNSSFDQRHKVTGTYLCELPFGKGKPWATSGAAARILEGFSLSGSFTFASGTPLTPSYQAASEDVARGTAGSLRPDRVPGVALATGGGSLKKWFNTAAFVAPAGLYGTASRNSIPGPGTIQNNMSLLKTMQLGGTRSMEARATANNVFNTVQYSGVDTNVASPAFGQVTSTASMRAFQFMARYRF